MLPRPFQAALNIAAKKLNRPDLGLVLGERTDLSILGPLYIAQMHAGNGREAIELAVRYLHTQTQVVTLTLAPLPDGVHDQITMRHAARDAAWLAQNLERNVVVLHRVLREAAGRAYWPSEIFFEHKRLSPLAVYQRVFGIAPDFGREHTALVLDRAMLDAARPGRNPQLRAMAEAYLKTLGPPTRPSLATETANMIRILCRSSDCSAAETARALGMHERTLQRRLQAEGATFDAIKDGVKRELAEQYLSDPALPLTQIAYLLHYGNSSAFTRASRRWFGKTPSAMRKVLATRAA
jgi:AraC-like DNA-binding protein